MEAPGQAGRIRAGLPWLIPSVGAWLWFAAVAARSEIQVLSLSNIENYALAVFSQLFWIWSDEGIWAQTIHFGYVDSWMWSGHRSGWLPIVGWLYGQNPDPVWLCRMQVALVALGTFPAFGIGRLVIGGIWGGVAGMVLYLGYPPLAAIALQDYQDLVLSIPLLLMVIWQGHRRAPMAFTVAALATCMVREELIPMVVLVSLAVPGSLRQRMSWVVRSGVVAGLYGAIIWYLGRDFAGYDNPMLSHSGDMIVQWPPVLTRTWEDVTNFYLPFLQPVHFLAVLSPITLLPGLASLFFHVTAPAHGGVDTTWQGHIHHMAPMVAFVVAGCIEGVGKLVRQTPRLGRWQKPVLIGAGLATLVATVKLAGPWMNFLGLQPRLTIGATPSDEVAPEWALAEKIPANASVATDTHASLVIANRRHAYTYDESLPDKRPGEGIEALDYILVRKRDTSWLTLAVEASGAERIGETPDYVLIQLR